jgi:hypothetical protein
VKIDLTKKEIYALELALDCEIASRRAAAHNDFEERCDLPKGHGAIDDEVPTMKRLLAKLKRTWA